MYNLNKDIQNFNNYSFDLDGTLRDDFDGTFNSQKDEIQEICKQLIKVGKNVNIITKRYDNDEKVLAYQISDKLNIPRNKVFFTNREFKNGIIEKLNIQVHFDNTEYECQYIKAEFPNINVICIEDPYWRDMVY